MGDRRTILLIDDDREIVRGISLRLRSIGLKVLNAFDGQQGLNRAIQEIPDAIVLDIRMPILDGWTVLARLKENETTAAIPVIVLSACTQDRSDNRALELGARFFLAKPYDSELLVRTLNSAISETAVPSSSGE